MTPMAAAIACIERIHDVHSSRRRLQGCAPAVDGAASDAEAPSH
jgi:hypothetical protein